MKTNFEFRVLEDRGTSYLVMASNGNIIPAEISGNLRKSDSLDLPTVGDWVQGTLQPGEWLYIDRVEPRDNLLIRQAASGQSPQRLGANIDFLFIATALNQDFNLNRLDRYVAMARGCGVQPVILLTKVDLVDDPASFLDQTVERFPDIDIHGVSAREGWNLESLETYLQSPNTVALMGSSGVGKSTLVNVLLGHEVLDTGDIRQDDGKGRHTTTHRSLHLLSNGSWLMDTPGLRSLALWDMEEGVMSLFQDIEALASRCKFTDCQHQTEPGCRIRKALNERSLSEERWQSFLKLQAEEAHLRRKVDKAEASKMKQVWKKRSMDARIRDRKR